MTHPGVGVHLNVPASVYHQWPLASSSLLKLMRRTSPAHMNRVRLEPEEPSEAMMIGSAAHMLALEGEAEYMRRYAIGGPINPKTHECFGPDSSKFKEWAKTHRELGKECLTTEGDERVRRIAQSMERNPCVMAHLNAATMREVSLIFRPYSDLNVLCKARIDAVMPSFGAIADIKTCRCASEEAVKSAIASYDYHIQAELYLMGASAHSLLGDGDDFIWFFAESDEPHEIGIYRMTGPMRETAARRLRRLLDVWESCERRGEWPGYVLDVVDVELPQYALDPEDRRRWSEF